MVIVNSGNYSYNTHTMTNIPSIPDDKDNPLQPANISSKKHLQDDHEEIKTVAKSNQSQNNQATQVPIMNQTKSLNNNSSAVTDSAKSFMTKHGSHGWKIVGTGVSLVNSGGVTEYQLTL